jgi:general secretion pathway protein D
MKMTPGTVSSAGGGGSSGTISFNGGRVNVVPPLPRLALDDARRLSEAAKEGGAEGESAAEDELRARSANIFVTVSRKNNMLVVRTSDAGAMDDIRALVARLDVPTPMVLLEVKVMELLADDDFTSSFEYEVLDRGYHRGDGEGHTTDAKVRTSTAGFPGFNPLSGEPRSDALSFRLLSWHLNARIQLLEKEGKARTLATPLLLTANNEVSRLFIGEERPMVRNITSQTIANGETVITVPQTEIEFQSVGTLLLITPNINADRTVTLRLLQENSEIQEDGATIPIYSAASGGLVQEVPVDIVSSRSVTGTFVAKDDMTMAVGGLIKEVESDQESRVPILGSIPLLGWLFRSTERVKQRTELIVLIRPHVISTPAEGEGISRRVLDATAVHGARDGRSVLGVIPVDPFGDAAPLRPITEE